jgi:hypothetical protein
MGTKRRDQAAVIVAAALGNPEDARLRPRRRVGGGLAGGREGVQVPVAVLSPAEPARLADCRTRSNRDTLSRDRSG